MDLHKRIRNQPLVNRIGFLIINNLLGGFELLRNRLMKYWPLAGKVVLRVKGVKLKMHSNGDDGIVDYLAYKKKWETAEINIWYILIKRADLFLDIGANTGFYTIFSSLLNKEVEIVSFEPHPANFERLVKNIKINKCKNVTTYQKAVGDSNSKVLFTVPVSNKISLVSSVVDSFSKSYFNIEYKQIVVQQVSLDTFYTNWEKYKNVLIKIDVEYYEIMVLKGLKESLIKNSFVILIEVFLYDVLVGNKPGSKLENNIDRDNLFKVESLLKDAGYSFYLVDELGILQVDSIGNYISQSNFVCSKKRHMLRYIPFTNREAIGELF